ncbi:MAG: HAMP domain-containing histidine kinase [Candidatus Levybacteria bacterium]|nr:HAMP domain-containing histidine kinase [Candidatus Levybacteria bacterium]
MGFSKLIKKVLDLKSGDTISNATLPESEFTHINQEMYKKSAELAERNKALSLLQKINELILGSITHPEEVAKQVVSILVTEIDFQTATIFIYEKDNKLLRTLAQSYANQENTSDADSSKVITISLKETENFIVQAVKERSAKYTSSLQNILVEKPHDQIKVNSVFTSPMYVRNELIGAIVIGMKEEQQALSEYRRILLAQLSELIGIGIDNSLLYSEVQNTNLRLKELDLLKNEFVSVASHELRTPMTAIKSYLWMALEGRGGDLNEKQRYYIQRGYNSVDRLIRLVNDMLNISRIEAGRITIDMQSLDLNALAKEVVEEVQPRAKEVGVKVSMSHHETLPHVLADPDKIKEVFFNLLGNSIKFTPKDGTVTVSFVEKDGFVQTIIKDTGSGIEADDISKLFQKFGLLPGSYTTNQPALGTGLGLYICRSIIDLHQGKIWAESEGRGKGSTFTFLLKAYNKADFRQLNKDTSEKKEVVGLIHSEI